MAAANTETVNGIEVSKDDPSDIFEILAKLGEGSYGSVFKALDKRDGKIVAIKVLEVENEDTSDLRKEINFLKGCSSDTIVAYKGSFVKDNQIWIVMEYCGAGSLCDLMAICEKTLTEEQIASTMKMSLQGLNYLHTHKKIHRDIKSGNILLTHAGECKLADFGVSAELTNTMSKRKTVIGTPYWMAPEVLQSAEYDGKADIWSLAITAIELAVGEPPHSNVHPMRAIFLIPTSDPPTLPDPDDWSADFNNFLKTCLQKDPAKRPTAAQLLQSHPFVLKAKGKSVIAQLVDECMAEIDEYREQEAKEAEEKDKNGGAGKEKKDGDADGGDDSETTVLSGKNDGTMVVGKGGADEPNLDGGGTTVFVKGADGKLAVDDKKKAGDKHTPQYSAALSMKKGQMAPATDAARKAAEEDKNKKSVEVTAGKKPAGHGIKVGGAAKKDPNEIGSSGTIVNPKQAAAAVAAATTAAAAPAVAVTTTGSAAPVKVDENFSQYYKTGRSLEVNDKSSLVELRKALIALNKAQEKELSELEAFYVDKRRVLLALIDKKEKK